jgi:hypothetical protein
MAATTAALSTMTGQAGANLKVVQQGQLVQGLVGVGLAGRAVGAAALVAVAGVAGVGAAVVGVVAAAAVVVCLTTTTTVRLGAVLASSCTWQIWVVLCSSLMLCH